MLANDKQLDTVLGIFRDNIEVWRKLKIRLCVDEERFKVLQEIAAGVTSWENEKLRNEIYLYGSMLKGSDLLGRQIFLWLLCVLEELETKKESIE